MMFLEELIIFGNETISGFNAYAKEYPIIAGAISLWLLSAISYLCRGIPRSILNNIIKYSTTTVTLTNTSESFFNFLKWYQYKGYARKGRYIKISNGRWGDDETIKSVGYGTHFFWYGWRLIILVMTLKESIGSNKERDEITMVMIGRSHATFDNIFNEVGDKSLDKGKTIIKKYTDGLWIRSSEQRPRHMDTIFLNKGVKSNVTRHLDEFLSREQWYLNNGIPYQTGILLYGYPGTGKTSLIKAIANYMGYKLHIISPNSLINLQSAMFELPEKSILVIEDIDTEFVTHKRGQINKKEITSETHEPESKSESRSTLLDFSSASLSDILNAIDGVCSVHGRILIATTNHIEKLDPALIRPGRIDLKVEIGFADENAVRQFFKRFYPEYALPKNIILPDRLTAASIQNIILTYKNDPDKALNQIMQSNLQQQLFKSAAS